MERVIIKKDFILGGIKFKKGVRASKVEYPDGYKVYIVTIFDNGDDVFSKDGKKFTRPVNKENLLAYYLKPKEIERYI